MCTEENELIHTILGLKEPFPQVGTLGNMPGVPFNKTMQERNLTIKDI